MLHLARTTWRHAALVASFWFVAGSVAARAQNVSTSDGLSMSLDASGRVTSVIVDGAELVTTPAPAIVVRDLSTAATVFAPNLLYNGDFEIDDGSGGADGWSVYLAVAAGVSMVSDFTSQGLRSAFFETDPATQADGLAAYLSSPFSVTAGQRYRLSAQILARDGYLAARHTAPDWQLNNYGDALSSGIDVGGIYVTWFDHPAASGNPLGAVLVAPMHTNASTWKRISGEWTAPAGSVSARVIIAAKLLDGKHEDDAVWIDDISAIAAAEVDVPVVAAVTQVGNDVVVSGNVPGAGLDVEATFHPLGDRIEISGRVVDTTASDHAFEVALRLPIDLSGYRWWDDMHVARSVSTGNTYTNTTSALATGNLRQSLYPLASLDDGTRAIALALPLDLPRVAVFGYTADRTLEARFALGISPSATRLGGEATFALYLYRSDPSWGFRAALEKFQSFQPTWFDTPRPVYTFDAAAQGPFHNSGGCLSNCVGPCGDCCAGADLVACYDAANIASGEYTAPEGPMHVAPVTSPPPSYSDMLVLLANPPVAEQERYPALSASMITDSNADFVIKHVTNPKWSPNVWETNWVLNMDPDIAGGYAEWTRVARIDPAFSGAEAIGAQLDAVQFDNFMSAPAIDLDPDHLALADNSLSFDPNSYRPGIHTMASTYEYLVWLRAYLDTAYGGYPALSANIWGIGTLNFLAPFLDAMGNETQGEGASNWGTNYLDYRRTIAYHKPLSSPWQRSDVSLAEASEYADTTLFYGIEVSQANNASNWEAGAEDIIAAATAALSRFALLGWEPVTRASTNVADVWVERFGATLGALRDSVYLTVRNWGTSSRSYLLSIDAAALGVPSPASVVIKDVGSGETLSYSVAGDSISMTREIGGGKTALVRLMAPGCSPTTVRSAKITLKEGAARDRLRLKGEFGAPATDPDFVASTVRLLLRDRDGDIYLSEVPAGGFSASGSGKAFRFKDHSGTIANGLRAAKFSRRSDGSYRWTAKAKNVDLHAADRLYLDEAIEIGVACWADSRDCRLSSNGRKLSCRP